MYCSNCGSKESGKFCSSCGTRLAGVVSPAPLTDWRQEIRYEVLLQHPEIRDRIARNAAQAVKGMSGEKWLELYDKLIRPPVSLKTVAEFVQPLYARLGIGTGKTVTETIPAPPGVVLAAVLCSLARNGREVKEVQQCDDGCVIDAVLPSDLFSLAGKLVITIHRTKRGMQVEAATRIPGQMFDWGKSRRCLNRLFEELRSDTQVGKRTAA